MAVQHALVLFVSALVCAAVVEGTCNNMMLGAEMPCCQGSLVGDACGSSNGSRGKCIMVETSNWVNQYNPDSLMCRMDTCKVDADCLDGNYCSVDTCVSGKCVRNTPKGCVSCKTGYHPGVCNDGNTCTKDTCASAGVMGLPWLTKCKHSKPAAGCVPATVPKYGQCGGLLYTGSKRCVAGTTCQKQYSYTQEDPSKLTLNPYYSQCL